MSEFNIIENLNISTNDRIAIFGRTGVGKTYLTKNYLLPHYSNYIFWDIKHENNDVPHDILVSSPKELEKALKVHKKILYQPKNITDKDFNDLCEVIFKNKDTTLYVDEAASITMPGKIQYWNKILVTQGRTYNIGIINASQRPRDIHNSLISESEHMFVFSLNLETDIIKVRQQIGDAADDIRFLPGHHFIYYSVRANKSFIFKPVKKPIKDEKTGQIKILSLEVYRPSLEEYIALIGEYTILTNITKGEKKRFDKLQKDGLLPSIALRKLETERRLGIIIKEESSLSGNTLYYVGGGVIGVAILATMLRKP